MGVKKNEMGRGVYASRDFKRGDIVEKAHVIIVPDAEVTYDGVLSHYMYQWDEQNSAVALGNASLYNHSYEPNLDFDFLHRKARIQFTALRDIKEGEELTINYNGEPDCQDQVYMLEPKRARAAQGR